MELDSQSQAHWSLSAWGIFPWGLASWPPLVFEQWDTLMDICDSRNVNCSGDFEEWGDEDVQIYLIANQIMEDVVRDEQIPPHILFLSLWCLLLSFACCILIMSRTVVRCQMHRNSRQNYYLFQHFVFHSRQAHPPNLPVIRCRIHDFFFPILFFQSVIYTYKH